MTFADYVGNARVVGVVRRLLAENHLPPALLFAGQKGVGKFTLATLMARAVNCERRPGEGCEECASCRALDALDDLEGLKRAALSHRGSANPEQVPLILRPHPRVSVLVPDGAYIRVGQMRYVAREAYLAPARHGAASTGGGRSLFLFDQAERLRFDYADVLLKVLEEPPAHTTLILVTAAPYELRATIRSRCMTLNFAPLTSQEIGGYLAVHRADWKKADRELATAAAAGSLGTALGLDLENYREVRRQALELIRGGSQRAPEAASLFAAAAALAGKGARSGAPGEGRDAYEFSLDILYSLLKDMVYWKFGTPECGICHPDLRSELERVSRVVPWGWLTRAVEELDRVEGWQRHNVNRQLALDAWAMELSATVPER